MSKAAERLRLIRHWQEVTGESEIDMHKVAEFALKMGWTAPAPVSDVERLAKQFKDAARQDIRHDKKTGNPYRGYHAVPRQKDDGQLSFSYIDIDDPKTKPDKFRKACVLRREQTVDDMLQLVFDQTHWNDTRPPEQQVEILPTDLTFDVELRMASRGDEPEAA